MQPCRTLALLFIHPTSTSPSLNFIILSLYISFKIFLIFWFMPMCSRSFNNLLLLIESYAFSMSRKQDTSFSVLSCFCRLTPLIHTIHFLIRLFAFQSHRNTTTCLMILLGTLQSRSSLVVFLDLEKAFVVANPSAILEALAEKVVRRRFLQWLEGFLTGRSACVRFQGHLSTSQPHTQQGSCFRTISFQRFD